MIDWMLSMQEAEQLRRGLEAYLAVLMDEIAHTEGAAYRASLRTDHDNLTALHGRLSTLIERARQRQEGERAGDLRGV